VSDLIIILTLYSIAVVVNLKRSIQTYVKP
jgi:hypothetical protein